MARYYRRPRSRRRYGYRRRAAPYGIDPLFWGALAIAVLIALILVVR